MHFENPTLIHGGKMTPIEAVYDGRMTLIERLRYS
jgi:hypothetical protein